MYALIVEYTSGLTEPPNLRGRATYRELLARLPGYRRRLDLQANGFRRLADLCLYESREAVEAALISEERRRFVAAHPACADTALAWLVREPEPLGGQVVLMRPRGTECRRETFDLASLLIELW